jgi:hypothetical protein
VDKLWNTKINFITTTLDLVLLRPSHINMGGTPPPREDNKLSLAGEGDDEVDGCGKNTLKYLTYKTLNLT